MWQEVKAAKDAESDMESVSSEQVGEEEEEEDEADKISSEKEEKEDPETNQMLDTVMKVGGFL